MDTAQALYEQIDRRISKLEDKVDPLLAFVAKEMDKKERIVRLRDFVSVTVSGSIAAVIGYLVSR